MAADAKPASPNFERAVREPLTPTQSGAIRKAAWVERLLSLWAPVTIFGIVFAIYITIVEFQTCAYRWLQMPLKVFGLGAVIYWVVLLVLNNAWKPYSQMRKARRESEELLSEIEAVMKKKGDQVSAKGREEIQALTIGLLQAQASSQLDGDSNVLAEAVGKLDQAADRHLMKWRRGGALDFVGGFAKALAVALAIRTLLIEPYKIPSSSMVPTLEIGDQIFVNKFIYGVRIPFTNFVPFKIWREPKRGDVIVFNNPVDTERDFVKRVIGVPGDTVELKDELLYVNGQPQPFTLEAQSYRWWNQDLAQTDWREIPSGDLMRETLNGQVHYVIHDPAHGLPFHEVVKVPPDSVFVMGDNRDNSSDGRFYLGAVPPPGATSKVVFVPYGNIKGKAMVIWLSLSHGGLLSGLFGGTGLRTDRLFQEVTMCGNEPPRDPLFAR